MIVSGHYALLVFSQDGMPAYGVRPDGTVEIDDSLTLEDARQVLTEMGRLFMPKPAYSHTVHDPGGPPCVVQRLLLSPRAPTFTVTYCDGSSEDRPRSEWHHGR